MKHYAGLVEYNTKGWLDKCLGACASMHFDAFWILLGARNNDRLLPECEALIIGSSFQLVASLRDEELTTPFRSISKKYCADLESLLQALNTCQLHYIRCPELQEPGLLQVSGRFLGISQRFTRSISWIYLALSQVCGAFLRLFQAKQPASAGQLR